MKTLIKNNQEIDLDCINRSFRHAVKSGDYKSTEWLLLGTHRIASIDNTLINVKIPIPDQFGLREALYVAIKAGNSRMINWLLQGIYNITISEDYVRQVTINIPDNILGGVNNICDQTAFVMAAYSGQIELMELLLQGSYCNEYGRKFFIPVPSEGEIRNAFRLAAHDGQISTMEWLIKGSHHIKMPEGTIKEIILPIPHDYSNAFKAAAEYGQINTMEWLLKGIHHIRMPDSSIMEIISPPLTLESRGSHQNLESYFHVAVRRGDLVTMEWLLKGAHHIQMPNGSVKVVTVPIPKFNQQLMDEIFVSAAKSGNIEIIDWLMEHVHRINIDDGTIKEVIFPAISKPLERIADVYKKYNSDSRLDISKKEILLEKLKVFLPLNNRSSHGVRIITQNDQLQNTARNNISTINQRRTLVRIKPETLNPSASLVSARSSVTTHTQPIRPLIPAGGLIIHQANENSENRSFKILPYKMPGMPLPPPGAILPHVLPLNQMLQELFRGIGEYTDHNGFIWTAENYSILGGLTSGIHHEQWSRNLMIPYGPSVVEYNYDGSIKIIEYNYFVIKQETPFEPNLIRLRTLI